MQNRYLAWAIASSVLLVLFSCSSKQYSRQRIESCNVFIEMPQNKLAFENLSTALYDALWEHFSRVGYQLCCSKGGAYTLRATIKDINSSQNKFLSPDLLTYASRIRVELLCQLLDHDDKIIATKTFICSSLIPKAKDYVANSGFEDFEYKKLFNRYAPKIDYYFRKFLLS